MKRSLLPVLLLLTASALSAQNDPKVFRAYLYNNIYEVYLRINFYEQDVEIAAQPLYGQLPGYLGKKNNAFCWPITSVRIKDDRHAELQLINDLGSEDLEATLECTSDSTYVLRQGKGSTLTVPKNGKWQKLPKVLEFIKK